ncbi:MAG: hypothetical protein Q4Q03_05075 [Bowdeniella nasicola]|nr:hypothetical protein [Bowdeniella nasicola]
MHPNHSRSWFIGVIVSAIVVVTVVGVLLVSRSQEKPALSTDSPEVTTVVSQLGELTQRNERAAWLEGLEHPVPIEISVPMSEEAKTALGAALSRNTTKALHARTDQSHSVPVTEVEVVPQKVKTHAGDSGTTVINAIYNFTYVVDGDTSGQWEEQCEYEMVIDHRGALQSVRVKE